MKAVILAAGKGSRLFPVTRVVPKPVLPLANQITLQYAFDRLKEIGVTEICVVVGETENEMKAALGDGSQFGVNLTYVRQTEPKGLAHAVGFTKEFVDGDSFVLYLGDAIYSQDLKQFADAFRANMTGNLSLVKPVTDPERFGIANVEGDRIVKLVEKPKVPESNLAMAGLYFFGPEIWDVLPDLKPSWRGEYEITDAIQALVDQGQTVIAGRYEGDWFDTGTLDSFLETNHYLAKGQNVIADDATVEGAIGENVTVGAGATVKCSSIEDCVILPGSVIETTGAIRHALLGGSVNVNGDLVNSIRHGDLVE